MARSIDRQLFYWGMGIAIFLLVVWQLSNALLPFVVGMTLAYLLDPIADRLQGWGLSRILATAIISILSLSIVALIIVVALPYIVGQLLNLASHLPEMATALQKTTNSLIAQYAPSLINENFQLSTVLENFGHAAGSVGKSVVERAFSIGIGSFHLAVFILVVPVVMIYMLADWDVAIGKMNSWLPSDHADVMRQLIREIDQTLSGFIRGQLTVCAIIGAAYAITLKLIGLDYGVIIGLLAGLLSFIPLVGPICGGGLAIGVALFQFWSEPVWIIAVAAVFILGQVIEGYILTPKLVGQSVRLHPVWLLLALSTFGNLFGFVGMLLSVPLAAIVGVLSRFAISQYLLSPLYRGHGDGNSD